MPDRGKLEEERFVLALGFRRISVHDRGGNCRSMTVNQEAECTGCAGGKARRGHNF